MTGYAASTQETDAGTITIEIKSVNSRFLDLQFRINDDFRSVEPLFREAISRKLSRGKVECRFSFGKKTSSGNAKALNAEVLSQIAQFQASILQQFPNAAPLTSNELLRWPGVIEEAEINAEALQSVITSGISSTLDAFITSREREGTALALVLTDRIEAMEAIVLRITPLVPQVVQQFQQKATSRMEEALGLGQHVGNASNQSITREEALDRVRQEVTLYGIRIDVAEELARLSAHLTETRHILKKGGQVGKRLDFMMQELNREANTLGSKAALKELADASMELKLLIEQMREQVQNLE
ncbi:YicC/YloC family endoribonuclease [Undibacterium sp. RTI2.1]|uniref:YicC/YloC family endoribonuclease n=1 Tax=unclassified Undibacterium TaxID=2630295 RepID=UPI002AB4AAC8|nr:MULTISPECIES: YicC/YloC family endoribonuclease [unclassified Undibacterium]MDY7537148.1 YicC/YloC family endoribonuclease [Undibacterium sp. 5I1]MEB0029813.1 YicC/YloC family endoribonuclease [Undibacterium sp. RTI2.1]MEB0115098.1 YicC/YloC family endoribonuclease [Undibacterium sp. RTI2.2]MEB0229326.1 YicC/YloC family endoribonuclease [Undibacterium sp. 10I3]MEB0256126.1 YicC/YloC family endoribonuclease [Undibacterium sp. 5I1]